MTTDIDALLEKARKKAIEYGELRGRKEVASERLKGVGAKLRKQAPKDMNIPDTDAWVRDHPEYREAVDWMEEAFSEWEAASIFMRLLLVEAEVWRTKQANDRYMDKAHR